MKKALEVEYWVVDGNGELTTPGELTEVSEYVEEEFVRPLFELKTPPCDKDCCNCLPVRPHEGVRSIRY